MTTEELAQYHTGRGETGDYCWLCMHGIAPGGECLFVPKDCEETAKMKAGAPYVYFKAHRACMELVP